MDTVVPPEPTLISSKEILDQTGISRATLNNYIRVGILPRPLVQRPLDPISVPRRSATSLRRFLSGYRPFSG